MTSFSHYIPTGEFPKCIGKQLCWSPFMNKLQAAGRLKKRLQQGFLRTFPEDCSKNEVFSHR